MTEQELQTIFESEFSWENWRKVMDFVFPEFDFSAQKIEIDQFTKAAESRIEGFYQHASAALNDGIVLNLFEVRLTESVNLPRNVKQMRSFIAGDAIANTQASVAVFYSPDKSKWRFTLAVKQLDDQARIVDKKPDSYTYVFGVNEKGRTAASRFAKLAKEPNKKLADLEAAFSVTALSKKFFDQYKAIYERFVTDIVENPSKLSLFKGEDREKAARDFVKKMMGRMVFLYFLQKKGWMGCETRWSAGNENFMHELFDDAPKDDNFYTQYLEPLFFETLNAKRETEEEDCMIAGKSMGKVPFLNGGLFEREPGHPENLTLPWQLFNDFFAVLVEFNFTIIEDDPDFKEVAVDPEMLGHIFENLLEDNKDKGAFYTPKEIVQYMCQESLIEYLNTKLSEHTKDEQLKEAIRALLIEETFGKLNQLDQDADRHIFQALREIKVCDPAIGSGAFPMGILHEIFRLLERLAELNPDVFTSVWGISWNAAAVKEAIIQNSIYGVDIEKGAVDIARLRFWLSIIIDEEEPKPLPNLDYKIMQGNSLLESFKGIDLSQVSSPNDVVVAEPAKDLFGNFIDPQLSITHFKSDNANKIEVLVEAYFDETDGEEKDKLREQIDGIVHEHIEYNVELKEAQLNRWMAEITNPDKLGKSSRKKYDGWVDQLDHLNDIRRALDEDLGNSVKNYFLWRLYFKDVLDNGGFDVVIANPPYLRVQEIARTQPENKLAYEENYTIAKAAYDLANLFFELAMNISNKQSTNCFIFPHKFFNSSSTSVFRAYLLEGQYIDKIVHFGANMVFNDADTYTCIAHFSPTRNEGFELAKLKFDPAWRNEIGRFKFHTVDYTDLKTASDLYGTNQWIFFEEPAGFDVFKKAYSKSKPFLNVFNCFVGLQTSYDQIYYLKLQKEDSEFYYVNSLLDESSFKLEKKYFKPILKGRDVQRYSDLNSDLLVFFPYNLGGSEYYNVALDDFKKDYPYTYEYIMNHEGEFKARERGKAGKMEHWYNYIYPKNLTKFEQPKLSSMEICAKHPNVTLDNDNFYHNTKVYSWLKKEDVEESYEYFLAIANSKLMWWFLKNTGDTLQGDARTFKTNYLNPFPLPEIVDNAVHDEFQKQVRLVLEEKKKGHDTKQLEETIDLMVFKLYSLSYNEAKQVDPDIRMSEEEYNNFSLEDVEV